MLEFRYQKPTSGETKTPNKSYYVNDIKLTFLLVYTAQVSTLRFCKI